MRRLMFMVVILLLMCGSLYLVTAGSSRPTSEPVQAVSLGSAAPDFQLQDNNGKLVSLSALRGKVVMVNFWATWCDWRHRLGPSRDRRVFQGTDEGLRPCTRRQTSPTGLPSRPGSSPSCPPVSCR